MPRVRFLQAVAGDDFSHVAGDVVEMTGEQAEAWADGSRAELVRGEPLETPERAAGQHETTSLNPGQAEPATAAPTPETVAAAHRVEASEEEDSTEASPETAATRRRSRPAGGGRPTPKK